MRGFAWGLVTGLAIVTIMMFAALNADDMRLECKAKGGTLLRNGCFKLEAIK